jgi:hypothetical protein
MMEGEGSMKRVVISVTLDIMSNVPHDVVEWMGEHLLEHAEMAFKDPRLLGDQHVKRILPSYSEAESFVDVVTTR